jgi:hypothetical protein
MQLLPHALRAEKSHPVKSRLPSDRAPFRAPGAGNRQTFAGVFSQSNTCLSGADAHCTLPASDRDRLVSARVTNRASCETPRYRIRPGSSCESVRKYHWSEGAWSSQYSVPRSVRMRNNETSCSSKKGRIRSFSMSAATQAFLRSYSLAKATLV